MDIDHAMFLFSQLGGNVFAKQSPHADGIELKSHGPDTPGPGLTSSSGTSQVASNHDLLGCDICSDEIEGCEGPA